MATIERLLDIMARLRDPQNGCPWDREQDFASISPFTIEEAYEVDEAIRSGDLLALRDELGDLLFQVVFQARIAEELGAFDFAGVVEAIASKLVRRHPHVFAEAATPTSLAHQTATWESIKAEERAAAAAANPGLGDDSGEPDPFAGIPRNLPALSRSAKLAGRLAHLDETPGAGPGAEGQAMDTPAALLSRLREGIEGAESMLENPGAQAAREAALVAVGEGLRTWVLLARGLGVDPEQALRQADDRRITAARLARST